MELDVAYNQRLGHELQCAEVESAPALIFGVFNWPHFGHHLGNGVGDVYATLRETGLLSTPAFPTIPAANLSPPHAAGAWGSGGDAPAGDATAWLRPPADGRLALFSSPCRAVHGLNRQRDYEEDAYFHGVFDPVYRAMTHGRPVQSLHGMLERSVGAGAVCFGTLVVGLSNAIDQYNVRADGPLLREFAGFLKSAVLTQAGNTDELGTDGPVTPPQPASVPKVAGDEAAAALAAALVRQVGLDDGGDVAAAERDAASLESLLLHGRPDGRFRVVLVSRKRRRVLNEGALTVALRAMLEGEGVAGAVHVVKLEKLTFEQQVLLGNHTNLLIGVDGTGLLSAMFMPYPCGAVIALNTFRMADLVPDKGANFATIAAATAGQALAWNCSDPRAVRLYGMKELKASNSAQAAALQAMLRGGGGPDTVSWTDRFKFVRMQDMHVDVEAVAALARDAMQGIAQRGCMLPASTGAHGVML